MPAKEKSSAKAPTKTSPRPGPKTFFQNHGFYVKWVHMAQHGLILKQDRALFLGIISGAPPDPRNKNYNPKMIENEKPTVFRNII